MQTAQEIAATIKTEAKKQGVAIGRMLEDCGLNINFVNQMKKSGHAPSIEGLYAISQYLGITLNCLLTNEEGKNMKINDLYKVPEAKLKKYLAYALCDLFSCEEVTADLQKYFASDRFGAGNANDFKEYINLGEDGIPKFANSRGFYDWLEGTKILDNDVQIDSNRLINFINLHRSTISPEISAAERRRLYPTQDEFERIALYVEKKPRYEPIFEMLAKEAGSAGGKEKSAV